MEEYARATLDRAGKLGAVRAQAFAWCVLGESLLLQARFEEAEGCLERSGELHASLGERSGALAWQRLAEVRVCRGDEDDAAQPLRRAAAIATVSPMALHLWGRIYATHAFAALNRDDPEDAVRHARAAAKATARYGDCATCSALLNPLAAEAYAHLGDLESGRAHADAARRVGGMFRSTAWLAMAESAEGAVKLADGDAAGARAVFEAAADHYGTAGQPYWGRTVPPPRQRRPTPRSRGTLGERPLTRFPPSAPTGGARIRRGRLVMDDRTFASGQWKVKAGKDQEFIELWRSWLSWTAENIPGFRTAKLLRLQDDPGRYTSISDWDDAASRTAWKTSPGFREKFESVKALCDEFEGGDAEVEFAVQAPALRS